MIWPIQQRLFLEDATPRNLIIGENIADDRLYANIFRDGSSCHLHVVGKILESQPILTARREVGRFNLREVMAGLELSCGEGHSGATGMSCRRAVMVSPRAFTDPVAVAAAAWRA